MSGYLAKGFLKKQNKGEKLLSYAWLYLIFKNGIDLVHFIFRRSYFAGNSHTMELVLIVALFFFGIWLLAQLYSRFPVFRNGFILLVVLYSVLKTDMLTVGAAPWYMLALIWYHIIVYLTRNMKPCHVLLVAVLISGFANYQNSIGRFLTLSRMLNFLENHDEVRLASKHFMKNAANAFPFVAMSALMNKGPFMIYNGQEYGEDADGVTGFSGDDGRTSIFDYVSMRSMLNGDRHSYVYEFYSKLLNFREKSKAIRDGAFYDLMWANPWYSNFDPQYVYAFLRYCAEQKLLIVINFNLNESRDVVVTIPDDAVELVGGCKSEYRVVLNPGEVKIVDLLNDRCRDGACTV